RGREIPGGARVSRANASPARTFGVAPKQSFFLIENHPTARARRESSHWRGRHCQYARGVRYPDMKDQMLLRRSIAAARDANCSPIAVVIGAVRDRIGSELTGEKVLLVENPSWQRGIGNSIRTGCGNHLQPIRILTQSSCLRAISL